MSEQHDISPAEACELAKEILGAEDGEHDAAELAERILDEKED